MELRFISFFGWFVMIAAAWAISYNRKLFPWRTVVWAVGLQFTLALLILKTSWGADFFVLAGKAVQKLVQFSNEGCKFVFGPLADENLLTEKFGPGNAVIFAILVTGTVVLVASLSSLLYHWGILQGVVHAVAWVMRKALRTSGSETLSAAANIFMGQTEAPLIIRPYVPRMTRSELMTIMVCGMAHISGGMMAGYIRVGGADAKNLLTAVIMTAPGTLLMAKMLVPETEHPLTAGRVEMPPSEKEANVLGAIARGTVDGLHLALNVGAMLIVFLALLALLNAMMGWVHMHIGWFPYNLQEVLGWIFAPVAWLIGIPWHDAAQIGNLLGTRMVLNEFVAFAQLGTMKGALDPRSFTIATFALCGFANFSSIGIQIGGIGALAPEQRQQLAKFGIRAMLAGTMANLMSASIVGILS